MDDNQLLRYSRQIMLPAVEFDGQQRLLESRVLVIGMGGLGSPVAMYLAAAGVGHLIINDDDKVDLSNLQRQIIHATADIDTPKTRSAQYTLEALNPDVHVETIDRRLSPEELRHIVETVDVVVDATDNFNTRFLINDACVAARKPLVSGAAIRWEGQVAVFRNDQTESPCYRCLYRDSGELQESCSESGVLAPIVGIIGSIQALETVKILLNVGKSLQGRLLLFDGTAMEWREIRLKKDPHCPSCSH
ncbi:MAG: molybdopterin-synthase adenylyltransferase MoeB [Gammaproteobacteria bacterium]|jgi:adenylyltransferase/sulfurtransferase